MNAEEFLDYILPFVVVAGLVISISIIIFTLGKQHQSAKIEKYEACLKQGNSKTLCKDVYL